MRKKVFYSITALVTISMFIFTSCDNQEKDSLTLNDLEIEQAEDDATADDVFNTLEGMIDDEVANLDANNYDVKIIRRK